MRHARIRGSIKEYEILGDGPREPNPFYRKARHEPTYRVRDCETGEIFNWPKGLVSEEATR